MLWNLNCDCIKSVNDMKWFNEYETVPSVETCLKLKWSCYMYISMILKMRGSECFSYWYFNYNQGSNKDEFRKVWMGFKSWIIPSMYERCGTFQRLNEVCSWKYE